ncbi:MAG TPA: hypothetical protein VH684_30615 [Xanthobacteraceae bacterium]|jgi:tetratricopeptide (TPR) repeat protein
MERTRSPGIGLVAGLAVAAVLAGGSVALAQGAAGAERFEVKSIKAVRPTLVETLSALQQRDIARARAGFEAYDSAWNGIEFYINTRSREMYNTLEHEYQARIDKALAGPNPDTAALTADAQAMLAKYDEAVAMVEKAAPLSPLYDDVARLRIVRADLRQVNPAIKTGNIEKARKAFTAFDDNWDSIEDLVKARSEDAYVAIEKGMIEIEKALTPDKPDSDAVTRLVNDVMSRYNEIVAQIAKEARASR